MVTYVYRCESCLHEFEVEQRITDKPIRKCPRLMCGGKVERLICEPIAVSTGPKTLGTLAEQNTKKMGALTLENKREESEKSKYAANSAFAEQITGGKRVETPETPWYKKQNSTTAKEIQKMTTKQKNKFIMEGKK